MATLIQGYPAHIGAFIGLSERAREDRNPPMTITEPVEYDQNVSTLRDQMDESAFAAVWTDGRIMALAQAVELALEEGGE